MDYQLNKLKMDEFGRYSGIIAIDKPPGITSHDVVYATRRALNTQKVGHAGALDPFASGLLLILVGKATKLADSFISHDKEYEAKILFGIKTDSADTEGEVIEVMPNPTIDNLADTLEKFRPSYLQSVPVYSSIKVDGHTLRVLARKADHFEISSEGTQKFVTFFNGEQKLKLELPQHNCKIDVLEVINYQSEDIAQTEFYIKEKDRLGNISIYPTADVRVGCAKGTYIRTLAEDIGQALKPPTPAMLIGLRRTRLGPYVISESLQIEDIPQLATTA